MKKIKRYVWLPALLFVYATVVYVYYGMEYPASWSANIRQLLCSYAIITLLFFVLRRREKLRSEREDDSIKDRE